jgi:hypothetical protein
MVDAVERVLAEELVQRGVELPSAGARSRPLAQFTEGMCPITVLPGSTATTITFSTPDVPPTGWLPWFRKSWPRFRDLTLS